MAKTPLLPGDMAPDFLLPASGGTSLSRSAFTGQRLVLYFYPQDDTPSCTNEAKEFAAVHADLTRSGAALIGVSKDSIAKHEKFITKFALPFRLISDEDGTLCEDFGVWGEKSMYGRTYMGILRTTFLIGPEGRIEKVWPVARVKGHAEEVLAAVRGH